MLKLWSTDPPAAPGPSTDPPPPGVEATSWRGRPAVCLHNHLARLVVLTQWALASLCVVIEGR